MVSESKAGQMMTVKEVSKILHIHSNTLRRWSDEGIIKSYRISRRGDRRFKREDINIYLAELNQNNGSLRKSTGAISATG